MTFNTSTNTKGIPIRGLMLDAARLVESIDYYRRFIDFCAAWQINTVIFRLTDDQGCALRFRSHPELVTHANALSPEDMRALDEYAQTAGVDLIPEIESLGHSQYITGTTEHADLNDKSEDGQEWANGLIPLHPKTMQLLGDLYQETASLFRSRYLHVGCDETNWGGSAFSRGLLTTRSRAQVWGEFLNALQAKVQALGREMIIWDDMVLQNDPSILDHLDRRIILHDWQYSDSTSTPVLARLTLGLNKGFRMIGGPALCWCKWGPRAGREQLRNIDAYADTYRDVNDARAMGVIVTQWLPSRHLQRSQWDGLAYAAVALAEGVTKAQESAFPRFVEKHYGTAWDESWAGVFNTLYDSTPTRQGDVPLRLLVPWANEDELRKAIAAGHVYQPPFGSILEQLNQLQPRVRSNHADFAAFRLTVAYLAHLYWRQDVLLTSTRTGRDLMAVLKEVARQDAMLAAQLETDWNDGRTGDPEKGIHEASTVGFGREDCLHGRFQMAARFSASLATGPRITVDEAQHVSP